MKRRAMFLLLIAGCGVDPVAGRLDEVEIRKEAAAIVHRIAVPAVADQLLAMGATDTVLAATGPENPARVRHHACLLLGRMRSSDAARDRLLEILAAPSADPEREGPLHLYAAAGLTLRADPETAVDLLLALSRINPNDNINALASEERTEEYVTVDAQICEALLAMGLWSAEEDLVLQMRRRARIRVLIDAHAILRRYTGLSLPFRYNGSYADRAAEADAWLAELRRTRPERETARPFDASGARFRARCADMMTWLAGSAVNDRLIARKVVERLGRHMFPELFAALRGSSAIAQRQAALLLGRIGDGGAAVPLRAATRLADADARAEAIDALRLVGDRDGAATVRGRLADADAEVRAATARFLGAFGEASDRDALRRTLASESAPGTATALRCALLARGDRSVVAELLTTFREGGQIERAAALEALEAAAGRSGETSALDAPEARRAAAARMAEWYR